MFVSAWLDVVSMNLAQMGFGCAKRSAVVRKLNLKWLSVSVIFCRRYPAHTSLKVTHLFVIDLAGCIQNSTHSFNNNEQRKRMQYL